jgi:CheY-like chemotaxis protein
VARILIADDERDTRDLVAFTLRFAGHEVFVATNGQEVIQMAPQIWPDLFILDVRMPRMTGYEACRILKVDPRLKNILLVFLSAKGQESEIQQGLDAGADEYWLKPFAPDQLTRLVNNILWKGDLGIYDP